MTHQHEHSPHHHHQDSDDFDWESMADGLELDAAVTLPIAHDVLATLDLRTAAHVLDVGCGPGVVSLTLAQHAPVARVTALDSSAALLARVRQRAMAAGLDDRIWTIAADLDAPLPTLPTADLIWASMVLHHVTDPDTTLGHLLSQLQPGGVLVMVEFGNVPTVLPPGDPLLVDGTWVRFQAATTAALNERLGLDPVTVDWPTLLRRAGFTDVTDSGMVAEHASPLRELPRHWLVKHLRRGLDMTTGLLSADDHAALDRLADDVPTRDDLFVRAERRVLIARRP
jgi:ubiquinone/menaquinone biosynthesis C-methylase UbiE